MCKLPDVWLSVSLSMLLGVSAATHAASSAKLSWTVPTARESGQVLAASELNGYELYYTTDDPSVTGTIKVSGGSTSTYTVQNLAPGNYHFAVSAIDVNGLKSKLSIVADMALAASTTTTSTGTGTTSSTTTSSSGSSGATGATGSSGSDTTASTPTSGSGTSSTSGTSTTSSTSAATGSKNIKVSWVTPTVRADGTQLLVSDLSGYTIDLIPTSGASDISTTVNGGSVNNYVISNVQPGKYILAIAAIDSSGRIGSYISRKVSVQ